MAIKFRRDTSANWAANNPIPEDGQPCFATDTQSLKIGDGATAYNDLPFSRGIVSIIAACSDETTPITAGPAKLTFRMPHAMQLFTGSDGIRAGVNTAPTGANIVIDVNEGGSSILSTKLSIDVSEKTSTTAAVPPVLGDVILAEDAEITIDFDQVGSGVAGTGVKVSFIGFQAY